MTSLSREVANLVKLDPKTFNLYPSNVKPKSDSEIAVMRQGGKMLATVLDLLSKKAAPGRTTKELAELAATELKKLGGEPVFLGYEGFPDVICISVNDEVVHGIPDERALVLGDIVGLDFGVKYRGLVTDGAVTIAVGEVSEPAQRLLKATEEARAAGIREAKAGARVGDIGAAVEKRLRASGLGVVTALVGHGVGQALHEPPEVPNFGKAGSGPQLSAGMTIAIEPMATLGSESVYVDADGWTIKTMDKSLAAQFEHTVLITGGEPEILTRL